MPAIGFVLVLAVASVASGGRVSAADYVYVPSPGIICTGGDTTGPTLGESMRDRQPEMYARLPLETQNFTDHIYVGTTCTQRIRLTGRAPIPGATDPVPEVFGLFPGIDPSNSVGTSPVDACSPPSGGCVTADAIFSSTDNGNSFNYTSEIDLYLDSYDGVSGSWTPIATNYHNNHGNSWGMSISSGTFNESDHMSYWTTAWGTGSYQYWNTDPGIASQNYFSEQVHFGYQATLQLSSGGQATYCWFGDFQAYNAGVIGGGWCANP
jgi:hypothetical protein